MLHSDSNCWNRGPRSPTEKSTPLACSQGGQLTATSSSLPPISAKPILWHPTANGVTAWASPPLQHSRVQPEGASSFVLRPVSMLQAHDSHMEATSPAHSHTAFDDPQNFAGTPGQPGPMQSESQA